MTDARYRAWRRLHLLSGALPVALYLVAHVAINAVAIAGPRAFERAVATLDAIPYVHAIELAVIAAPILVHVALGIALANTAQAVESADRYPRPWMQTAQRVTGGVLVVYACFHVWGTRLSPELLAGKATVFDVMRGQLAHPGTLALHVVGLAAACVHVALGFATVPAAWWPERPAAFSPVVLRASAAAGVGLGLVGLNALLAFVSPAARWLER